MIDSREKAAPASAQPQETGKDTGTEKQTEARSTNAGRKALRAGKVIVITVCAVLVAAVLGAALYVNGKLNKLNYHEQAEPLTHEEVQALSDPALDQSVQKLERRESAAAPAEGDVFENQDIINILVCGTDMRQPNTKDLGRCDAAVIVSLNRKTGGVKLIGFERSIGVPTPGEWDTKLNNAFNYGGGAYMQEVLSKCFLVDLAGYVHLSYDTIAQVFDAIGGIDVELDSSEVYHISEFVKYEPDKPHLQVGMNNLRGWAAYGYCRLRDADDNYARQRRVRNALQAALGKVKTMSVAELDAMANEVLPLIGTNLTKAQISSLILQAPKFKNAVIEQMSVPEKGDGWSYQSGRGEYMLGLDFSEWSRKIQNFILEKDSK